MFMQHHDDTIINRCSNKQRRKTSLTIFTSHFIARVRKGFVGFYCERELEIEHKLQYFDLHSLWPSRCVFLILLMLNRSPGVHSAGCWLSLLHLISIFSGPQLIRAKWPLRPGVAFPTTPCLQLYCDCPLDSNSTVLYNSSTPTRSLKSHV